MNTFKVFVAILPLVALAFSAVIPEDNHELSRQKRTLGLLTAGAGAVSDGISTAGAMAATAVGILSAVKPLILLGLGKYALYNWLNKNENGNKFSAEGFGINAGVNFGDPAFESYYYPEDPNYANDFAAPTTQFKKK